MREIINGLSILAGISLEIGTSGMQRRNIQLFKDIGRDLEIGGDLGSRPLAYFGVNSVGLSGFVTGVASLI
jgi:hypothetical protein